MSFGKRRAAVAAVVMVCGAMALVPFVSAQTLGRDLRYDVFRAFGAGSEIGVSVRELSNDEVSKAGLERAGGVYVQSVREGSPAARADIRSGDLVVGIDGERVRGLRHFVRLVSESPAGRRCSRTPSGSRNGAGLSSGPRQERNDAAGDGSRGSIAGFAPDPYISPILTSSRLQ